MAKRKFQNAGQRKKYKRFIEIKTNRKGWTVVELISVNKGGTITFKLKGQIIKRKLKHIRWSIKYRIPAAVGIARDSVTYNSIHRKKYNTKKKKSKPVKKLNVPYSPKPSSLDILIKSMNKKAKSK